MLICSQTAREKDAFNLLVGVSVSDGHSLDKAWASVRDLEFLHFGIVHACVSSNSHQDLAVDASCG